MIGAASRRATLYRYRTLAWAHVLPAWAEYLLADVTHADVATWVAQLRSQRSAPGTVRQAHRVFSLLLDLAVRDGRIPRNPAERVPLPRIVRGEPRFLTREEVEVLAEAAGDDGDVIRLLANTGLRFASWPRYASAGSTSSASACPSPNPPPRSPGELVFGTPKTHRRRTVPLPAELVEPLARRCEGKQPDDLLVTTQAGTPLRLRNWRRVVLNPAVEAPGSRTSPRTTYGIRPPRSRSPAAPTPRAFSACSATPPPP